MLLVQSPKGLIKGLEDLKIKNGDHPNNWITEIGQNTEMSPWYHSYSSERPSANADVKNSQGIIIIIMSSKGGRGLTSIEDIVDTLIRRLEDYTKKSKRKTNNSDQKQYKQHNDKPNNNNLETKIGWERLYGYFK